MSHRIHLTFARYICIYKRHCASRRNSDLLGDVTLSLSVRKPDRDVHLEFRLCEGDRKRNGRRENVTTKMRHIIAVQETLSRRLMECKYPSGISRFNHECMYTFVPLCRFLVTLRRRWRSRDRPRSNAIYIFIRLCLKMKENEICIVMSALYREMYAWRFQSKICSLCSLVSLKCINSKTCNLPPSLLSLENTIMRTKLKYLIAWEEESQFFIYHLVCILEFDSLSYCC